MQKNKTENNAIPHHHHHDSYLYRHWMHDALTYTELKPTFLKLIGMSPRTKAMSVGFTRRESGVETVLLTFHFEEQPLIGYLSNLLNCWLNFVWKTIFTDTFKEWINLASEFSRQKPHNFYIATSKQRNLDVRWSWYVEWCSSFYLRYYYHHKSID